MSDNADVVLVLPVLQPAGAERIVAELARRLPAEGFRTAVVCLEDERAPVGAELAAAGIPVQGLRLSRRRTLACATALAAVLPERRPLIVHAHLFHANLVARMAYARMSPQMREGIHVLSTVHVAERRFRPWQFALDRFTAAHARAEICVSRAVAAFQQEHTGLPREFFRVIENGIDLSRFGPAAPRAEGEAPLVVSVGRLDPQKDFATLLRAWKTVQDAHPGAELAIAGDGPEAAGLRALCTTLSLQRVKFLGLVLDVPALLRRAALYAQPSAWEGFGLTVAEAMACALPVVVTDADSLPELVTHRKTGLVVPKGQPEELARAMLELLKNQALAVSLGAAARAEAVQRFAVERMVADYARVYREILCAS
ncbi:MAG: glycosyltransferase [Planctomycetota bacterium]|nr:glycosyltransferase [Planctomycetota bacterium]